MGETNETPQSPAPSSYGTKRTHGNMLNEYTKHKKPHRMSTHWELPQKLKLKF
jgi:hypothetical protein